MHLYDLVGPERFAAVVPVLAGAFVKATAILILGTVCSMLARGASAATRHMIWTLTLGGALVAPVVSAVVPRWSLPMGRWSLVSNVSLATTPVTIPAALTGASSNAVLALAPRADDRVASSGDSRALGDAAAQPRSAVRALGRRRARDFASSSADARTTTSSMAATAATAAITAGTTTTIESHSITVTPDAAETPVIAAAISPSRGRPSLAVWLLALWALGTLCALAPTLAGFARLAIIARRARPMRGGRWALLIPSVMRELDVRRRVRFIELDGPVMPMTWGVFRPIVLVPSDDFNSTIEQRVDVLRHELAHVRRYDCLTQLVGQLACAVHWFNPLAWIAARELRVERERACDDEVLRAGAKASDYADYLLRVARSTRIVGAAALGGLAMARPSQMAGRLLAVLDDRRRRDRVSRSATAHAALVAGLLVTGVAAASPADARSSDIAPAIEPVQGTHATVSSDAFPVVATGVGTSSSSTTPSMPAERAVGLPAIAWSALASPPAPMSTLRPQSAGAPCDRTTHRDKGSHTNWTSSDNGSKRWLVRWSEGDCSYEIEARGEVKFNRDVTDIESISAGGNFTLEQHLGDDTRRLVVRPNSDGSLERSYSENGARREFDSAARAWLAEALVALDRQTAFAADQRVPSILERGGVDAVLQEITLVSTDYARRRYYTKLLSMRQLDRSQIKRIVEQAGADMSSDYELAELLVTLSKLDAFGDDSHPAFVTAAKKINSDYERRRALNALLQRDRLAPATVQSLLDAASTIGSDYELAELLIDVSKRYAMNDQTRPTYIKALGSIKSDYEHRRVLAAIVAGGGLTPAVNRTLLEDASRIGSDYELTEFLIQMGKKGALDASTRDAYFAAADKISSDYEHHRALTPLLTKDLLTKDLAKAILASAAKIDSDYECSQLLLEVANAIAIDDELRPAFEKAADTIQGEYEYGRAMSAVRRRVTR